MKLLLCVAIVFFKSIICIGQINYIVVVDCDTKNAIKDVSIFYQTGKSNQWNYLGLTKSDGKLMLPDTLESGLLSINHLSYTPTIVNYTKTSTLTICLDPKFIELNEIVVKDKIQNPFIHIKGGKFRENKKRLSVEPFQITQKEISIAEFEEFVRETNYITEVEALNLNSLYYSGVKVDGQTKRIANQNLLLYNNFRDGNFEYNKNNSLVYLDTWRFYRSKSDTLKWYHNEFGEDMRQINPTFPVIRITYNDAQNYAKWVGGRLPRQEEYLLLAKKENSKSAWNFSTAGGLINATGTSPKSSNQLYDFYGNVSEYLEPENQKSFEVIYWHSDRYSSPFTEKSIKTNSNYIEIYENPILVIEEFIGFRVVKDSQQ